MKSLAKKLKSQQRFIYKQFNSTSHDKKIGKMIFDMNPNIWNKVADKVAVCLVEINKFIPDQNFNGFSAFELKFWLTSFKFQSLLRIEFPPLKVSINVSLNWKFKKNVI